MLDKAKLYLKKIQLKNKQKVIAKKMERDGLTDEVLKAQVELNQLRNKHNISDSDNAIYENFVQ